MPHAMETSSHTRLLGGVALVGGVLGATCLIGYLQRRRSKPSVAAVLVYPVKSCAEVSQKAATALATGFRGDRIAQVSDAAGKFCTPRTRGMEKLFHVRCALSGSTLRLSLPGSGLLDFELKLDCPTTEVQASLVGEAGVNDKAILDDYGDAVAGWLAKATGIEDCRLQGIGKKYGRKVAVNPSQGDPIPENGAPVSLADEAPFLLTSQSSLDDLNRRLAENKEPPLDMRRFRPNIVIQGLKPWEEDTWKKIRIGGVEFWIWQRCGRCEMTTIDRDSLSRGKEPLKTMRSFRKRGGNVNFGMHLVPTAGLPKDGSLIKVGDRLEVLEYDEERVREFEKQFGAIAR